MEELKRILTGVSDYGEFRRGNGCFIDHTNLAADRNLAAPWRLRPEDRVSLIRLSVVFHGPELAAAEAV